MKLTLVHQERISDPATQGFAACHASTLVRLESGEMLCAYFAGAKEGSADQAIWLSRRDEQGWQKPRLLLRHPGTLVWNPVFHPDAERLLLYYKKGDSVVVWTTMVIFSLDGGLTWSQPREVVEGEALPRATTRNAILHREKDGAWLAPNSVENGKTWDAFVDISTDRGSTWVLRPIPIDHDARPQAQGELWSGLAQDVLWENDPAVICQWDGIIQPALWESAPDQIHALMRSTRGRVYRSDSTDGGEIWCSAYPVDVPNNNSALDLVHLGGGRLILICNPVQGNWAARSPLSLLVSGDNGRTFERALDLETDGGEYSYPCIRLQGRLLDICYTSRRESIAYAQVKID